MPAYLARDLQTETSRTGRRTEPRQGFAYKVAGRGKIYQVVESHGAVFWYDSRDLALADGDAVTSWTSREGGNTLEQVTGTKQPSYTANGWNGGPTVDFGSDDGMSAYHTGGIESDDITIVALASTTDTSGTATILEYTGNVYNNRGFSLLINAGKVRAELGADSARSYAEGGDAVTSATPFVAGMRGTRETNPDQVDIWNDGGEITPSSSGSVDGSGDHEQAYLYVGSRLGGGSRFLSGSVRSILALPAYVSDAEMQTLLDGMATLHGGFPATGAPAEEGGGGGAGVTYNFDEVHNTEVTEDNGTLYDDGGPDGPYSSDEYWVTITAPGGQQVQLTFVSFELGNPGAWYERLRVWDNNASSGTILGEFFGSMSAGGANAPTSGQTLTSTSGHVFIRQDSSTSGVNAGFEIQWEFV